MRNDIIFDKVKPQKSLAYADFLCNYVDTLTNIKEGIADDGIEGKKMYDLRIVSANSSKASNWSRALFVARYLKMCTLYNELIEMWENTRLFFRCRPRSASKRPSAEK